MLHLHTFGTLNLTGPGTDSADPILSQPRSTALLVYLLLARPRGFVTRDTLCLLFWPESDQEHARGSLSQALSRIRRSLGRGILEARGKSDLRIAPGAMACDVFAFEEAISNEDHRKALKLYAGAFLQGFHAPNARGFEEWADAERERLRRMALEAARGLAHRLIKENRLPDAVQVASRALTLAPESEAVASELVRALADAGERAGALHLYDSWSFALSRDLELEPGKDLRAWADQLREDSADSGNRPVAHLSDADAGTTDWPREVVAPLPTDSGSSPGTDSGSSPWKLKRRTFLMATGLLAFVLLSWGAARVARLSAAFPVEASGRSIRGLGGGDWLLVADVQAPSVDPGLALAFQTLLARDLESAGYASVVGGVGAMSRRGLGDALARMRLPPDTPVDADLGCEIAQREGAAGVLASRLLPLGSDYVLEASILAVPECAEAIRTSAVASFDELSEAVSAVSRELRARLGESRASIRSSPPLPPITTTYVEALRAVAHYLDSPDLWDDEAAGVAALEEALRIEPDFAFAHFLLALHYQRLGRFEQAIPHFQQAYAARSELPRQGQLGMEAIHQRYLESDPRAAMVTVRTLIADYPALDDVTLPFLTDVAAWTGDWQQALDISLQHLRQGPVGLGGHLSRDRAWAAAWGADRVELADSLFMAIQEAERADGLAPDPRNELLQRLHHRDWTAADQYCAGRPTWDRCGYVYLATGRFRAAAMTFGTTLSGEGTGVQPLDRIAAAAALSYLEFMRGRPDQAGVVLREATRSMAAAGTNRAAMHLTRFLLCGTAAIMGQSEGLPACAIEAEDPDAWDADPSFTILLRSGAWSRRLLALRSLERGEPDLALHQAMDAVRSNFGYPGLVDHLILAKAFDDLSQPDSALFHYTESTHIERDGGFPTAAGILFPLAPVYRRIGELAEASADTSTAVHYYGALLDLWADADPEFRPQVEEVRRRLAGLTD